MFALACPMPSLPALQEIVMEWTIEAEIESLIAKTNALRSFHAVYRGDGFVDGETTSGTITIAYEDSGRGHFGGDFGESSFETWFDREGLTVHAVDAGVESWKAVPLPELASLSALERRFPAGSASLGPGVVFDLTGPGMGAQEDEQVHLNVTWSSERQALLRWLGFLRTKSAVVRCEGAELIWSNDHTTCRGSRSTGFVERMEYRGAGEDIWVLELESLDLNEPVSFIHPPEEAKDAQIDEEMSRSMYDVLVLDVRRNGFRRVGSRLNAGELTWNEGVHGDWRAVLEAIHRERIPRRYSPWQAEMEDWIDGWAEHVRSIVGGDPADEELGRLHDEVDQAREELVGRLAGMPDSYLDELPEIPASSGTIPDELFEMERDVVAVLVPELVNAPALSTFDECVNGAFVP